MTGQLATSEVSDKEVKWKNLTGSALNANWDAALDGKRNKMGAEMLYALSLLFLLQVN